MKYHWKIILPIIHLKFNDYLLKYFHWHLSDIGLSLLYISYISLKFQRSFQTVYQGAPPPVAAAPPLFADPVAASPVAAGPSVTLKK
jgi:hypothetical protein